MSKNRFLLCVKTLILLSPLPFGCAGRIWSPLFYLSILVLSSLALWQIQSRVTILWEKKIRLLGLLFFGFLVFQMIPLPRFILKIVSPSTIQVMDNFGVAPIRSHSLSLVPADTLMFLMHLLVMVFFLYVLVNLDLTKADIYSMINWMMVSAFFQATFALVKKYIFKGENFFIFFHPMKSHGRLVSGTFVSPEHFSFYLELIFPLLIGIFLIKGYFPEPWESSHKSLWVIFIKNRILILYLLSFPLFAGSIWLSKSLTGQMALFLSLFFMAAGFLTYRMKGFGGSARSLRWAIPVITLFLILFALQNTMSRVNRPDREGNIRSVFWEDAGKIFMQFPVTGAGYGNFKNVSYLGHTRSDETKLPHAYNEYLEHLGEGGILGAGLFFTFLGLILFSLFKMWLIRHHPEVRMMGLAIIVGLGVAVFHGVFDFAIRVPANGFLFILLLGLGLKMVLYKREIRHEEQ